MYENLNKQSPISEKQQDCLDNEVPRKASMITLARVSDVGELNAASEKEGDKKFKEKTKELWKEFAVHGVFGVDKETKQKTILNFTDLDGKCAIGLLKIAGIDTRDIKYVAPGTHMSGRINIDTGDKHGVVIEDEGKTAFFDHHSDESGKDSSATNIVYETLVSLGMIEKTDYLDHLVEFVTQMDNRTYPEAEKYFNDSWRTVLGLQRFLSFDVLLNYFKSGRTPTEILSDKEIKSMGLERRSSEQKKSAEDSIRGIDELTKEGFVVESDRYGKIVVDVNKKIPAGIDAVRAHGCGSYIIWNPAENSFFITTPVPIAEDLSQGIRVRETMWVKPRHDGQPLTIKLEDILTAMTNGKFKPSGKLAEYIKSGK